MSKRILLTGATGFVGPRLKHALQSGSDSPEILCWARHSEVAPEGLVHRLDICSKHEVMESIKTFAPTHVVHLAAQSHVPTSFKDPEETWRVNVMGTLNLFEALREHTPSAAVLYISSSEVYGHSFRHGVPLDESALLQPRNPYAASKAAADLMAGQYAEFGLRVLRIRPFNHIGPGQSENFVASAFAAQIARIEAGQQAPVLRVGNLDAQRDFLDVEDVVRAYALALDRLPELPAGLVLNLCSGQPRRIRELLDSMLAETSCIIQEEVDHARMRPSDTPFAVGLAQAAHRHLGWSPAIPFQKTIQALLNDWRQKVRTP